MSTVDEGTDFALIAWREGTQWETGLLPERLVDDLDGLVAAVRQQPTETTALALVNVADEFFVAVRVTQGGPPRILLSDVTAAAAWDLAAQVCLALDLQPPDDDEMEDVLPAGDLSIFSDLGMDEMELGMVLADLDAYADEQLETIADRLGFLDGFERVLEAVVR